MSRRLSLVSSQTSKEPSAEAPPNCWSKASRGLSCPGSSDSECPKASKELRQQDSLSATASCNGSTSSTSTESILTPRSIHFVGSSTEVGGCFEALSRQQQQQARIIQTEEELRGLVSEGLSGGPPSYLLVRNRRLQLQDIHTGSSAGTTAAGNSSGAPLDDFAFPLEMGPDCGCAALLPFAVGIRVCGASPFSASLLSLSFSSGAFIVDMLNKQPVYAAAVSRLLQWVLPNPLIVKVFFDVRETLERLARGPLPLEEGLLPPLVHAIDLRYTGSKRFKP